MTRFLALLLTFAALIPVATAAEQLCSGQNVPSGPDGRMLGHIPYMEASPATLVAAPAGFAVNGQCLVNRDMAPDLGLMLAAARAALGPTETLRAVSCFRSIAHQRAVFCSQIGPGKRCANAAERARSVGPPGYSEHATGYAIDFGTRPAHGCGDVSPCFAATPAGRWLIAHAPDYGFELSFPPGNAQGVTWEPWHWRWVGASLFRPGAAAARQLFARARTSFPAHPSTPDGTPFGMPAPTPVTPFTAPPPGIAPGFNANGAPAPLPAPAPSIGPPPPTGGR